MELNKEFENFINHCTDNLIGLVPVRGKLRFESCGERFKPTDKAVKPLLKGKEIPEGFVGWFENQNLEKLEEEREKKIEDKIKAKVAKQEKLEEEKIELEEKVSESDDLKKEYEDKITKIETERFSKYDCRVWDGIKVLKTDNGINLLSYTGNGREMMEFGSDVKQIFTNFLTTVDVKTGQTKASFIEFDFFANHLRLGSKEIVELEDITSEKISSVLLKSQLVPKSEYVKTKVGNIFRGFSFKVPYRFDIQKYLKDSTPSFLAQAKPITKIKDVSNNKDEDCLCYLDNSPCYGETTEIDKWLASVIKDTETRNGFMAWLGSTIDSESTVRSALYIQGNGADGKSNFFEALNHYFGNKAVSITGTQHFNQFSSASCVGKRLIMLPDLKDMKFVKSELFHTLTGNDYIKIEKKGQQPYSVKSFGRMIIASNESPDIDADQRNHTTRFWFVKLDERTTEEKIKLGILDKNGKFIGDPLFKEKLKKEIAPFMYKCYQLYLKNCPNHGEVLMPTSVEDNVINYCADQEYHVYVDIIERKFLFDKNLSISSAELAEVMNEELIQHGIRSIDYKRLGRVFAKNGANTKIKKQNGKTQRMWVGVGKKPFFQQNTPNANLDKAVEPIKIKTEPETCEIDFD